MHAFGSHLFEVNVRLPLEIESRERIILERLVSLQQSAGNE